MNAIPKKPSVDEVDGKAQKKLSSMGFSPDNDGVDHINIHPRSKVVIGRLLSFYRNVSFIHPCYGPFYSIEGFSHYIRTGCKHDGLRYVSGFEAKKLGKSFGALNYISQEMYRLEVMYACYEKIRQNHYVLQEFLISELPFDSYYQFGPSKLIIDVKDSGWITSGFVEMRQAMKTGDDPEFLKLFIEKYKVSA